jgi:hypothetical protein
MSLSAARPHPTAKRSCRELSHQKDLHLVLRRLLRACSPSILQPVFKKHFRTCRQTAESGLLLICPHQVAPVGFGSRMRERRCCILPSYTPAWRSTFILELRSSRPHNCSTILSSAAYAAKLITSWNSTFPSRCLDTVPTTLLRIETYTTLEPSTVCAGYSSSYCVSVWPLLMGDTRQIDACSCLVDNSVLDKSFCSVSLQVGVLAPCNVQIDGH